jgi:plasmid stabilization system protein ParE
VKRLTRSLLLNSDAAMRADLVWSAQAQDDLEAIFGFLEGKSPKAARSYTDGIIESCERLRDFPESGPAYSSRTRMLGFRNHVIFYRHNKSTQKVIIAKVVDGRRDYGRLFEDILK